MNRIVLKSLSLIVLIQVTVCIDVIWVPSPNIFPRPEGTVINTLVIHHTNQTSFEESLFTLTNPNSSHPVSSHYLIAKNGTIAQLVDLNMAAHHAGVSSWRGIPDLNNRSIGIELDNTGIEPFSPALISSLKLLIHEILANYTEITQQNIVGHDEIAPTRKDDPSEYFPWEDLAINEGIGYYPTVNSSDSDYLFEYGDNGDQIENIQAKLKDIGYLIETNSNFDDNMLSVVQAFKRRYTQGSFSDQGSITKWSENDDKRLNQLHSHYFNDGIKQSFDMFLS